MPGPSLADRIEQLSSVEAFSPPTGFAAQARVRDPGDYARAAADGPAWWAEQARQRLDWHTPFSAVLERCPIVDTWWQTETGAIMISPLPGVTPAKPGSATRPLPGVSAALFDEEGREIEQGSGLLVLTQPWPSMLRTLYGDPDRFVQTYFARFGPRVYVAGDGARRDEDGYLWITGRVDDVINVSGHRLSTAEIESALVAHPAVAEAAVIATSDELTGQAVVAYVTLGQGRAGGPALEAELRDHIAGRIGKLARPKQIIWAEDLPKTRSGKIMRRLLRDIAEGREPGDVTTLRDTTVLDALKQATTQKGSTR